MKHLILLVGPPGSGKTTYGNKNFPDYARVSQDDFDGNRIKTIEKFLDLIQSEAPNIIVDRMNFDRDQRARWGSLAKEKGYKVDAYVVYEPFSLCYNRVVSRKDHPTIKEGDSETALNALRFFKKAYRRPSPEKEEYLDSVYFVNWHKYGQSDFYMRDLTKYRAPKVVIGDVHGCAIELKDLLYRCEGSLGWGDTITVLSGDLVDKGPSVGEVLELYMNSRVLPKSLEVDEPVTLNIERNMFSVIGNHDDKLLRYLRGNNVNTEHMKETLDSIKDWDEEKLFQLTMALEDMTPVIKLDENAYVVHAGIDPERSVLNQDYQTLLYVRSKSNRGLMNDPAAPLWYEVSKSNPEEMVFFGHNAEADCWGKNNNFALDSGCVYGDKLTAAIVVKGIWDKGLTKDNVVKVSLPSRYKDRPKTESGLFGGHELEVNLGNLKRFEDAERGLIGYNYTKHCAYAKNWNEITLNSRGTVYEKDTGKLVAWAWPKFFNVGETEATQIYNLPKCHYRVYEKVDGSLGIVYHHNGEWLVNTRGSFTSDQAIMARKMLGYYRHGCMKTNYTYLVEIIYPENKIIVDYGDEEKLVLLGAFNNDLGIEMNHRELVEEAEEIGMEMVQSWDLTIKEMLELQKTMPKDREGFVVRFFNGSGKTDLRVKFKGEEYFKLARIMGNLTPLSVYRAMKDGKLSEKYLVDIPEEFRPLMQSYADKLEESYHNMLLDIKAEAEQLKTILGENFSRKDVGLYLSANKEKLKHHNCMFSVIFPTAKNTAMLDEYIMDRIKPKGNVLDHDI
jgi:RNA ligase